MTTKRTVVIGPASWYSINLLEKLELPEADRQIIASVHYYNPFAFTHQGAPWTGNKDKVGVAWNGTDAEQQAIVRDFDKTQTWARRHNRPLYLGEFGAYDKGDMASRVRWTSFVARSAEKLGWSWGYWQFDGDFIVYDIPKDRWVEPIRDALIPKEGAAAPAPPPAARPYEVAAFYFPGYHPTPRNDARLGKGWTEWELVKAARPRFPGHAPSRPRSRSTSKRNSAPPRVRRRSMPKWWGWREPKRSSIAKLFLSCWTDAPRLCSGYLSGLVFSLRFHRYFWCANTHPARHLQQAQDHPNDEADGCDPLICENPIPA